MLAESQNQKVIEGIWVNDEFQYEEIVKVTVKDKNGKAISNFEGKVNESFNPIFH